MLLLSVLFLVFLIIAGMPLFLGITTATLIAFNWNEYDNPYIFLEMLRLTDAPVLLAIPLFTFTGFILAASKAPGRLIYLNNILLKGFPGGLAIVAIVSCALLTAFTGASGVTIIALGGLLYPSLIKQGYKEPFVLGLLTTAGSRGLLFPPSLPLILYAVVAKLNIDQLFLAGLIPGLLGVLVMTVYAMSEGKKNEIMLCSQEQASLSLGTAWYEIPLPLLVLGGIYSGIFTVTEAATVSALYALILEVFILKEVNLRTDFFGIVRDSMVLVGSVFIILTAALGFTSFLVDQQIPMKLLKWISSYIDSPILFLLCLNIFLLIVGCLMDIFSAIIIIVPLIYPIATELGVNPFHLGIIFLTNLEIGYSTPPIGLNLFIASKRFDKNIFKIYRAAIPFLLLLLGVLMIITFVPSLSLFLLKQ